MGFCCSWSVGREVFFRSISKHLIATTTVSGIYWSLVCTVLAHSAHWGVLRWCTIEFDIYHHTPHHDCFTALFPGPPGWAGARRELLDFIVQGKINRGRHTNHQAGRHSIRTNQCPPPPSPIHHPSCCPTNIFKALKATSAFGLGRRC